MPICGKCLKTLICKECGADPGPQSQIVGNTVLPCKEKAGLWIRVRDHLNRPVPGVTVLAVGKPAITQEGGFAAYEDVEPGEHTVSIALEGDIAKTYKFVGTPLTEQVGQGEIRIFSFNLLPLAKPILNPVRPAVAVKGAFQEIRLSADAVYAGKGVFTCTKGADKVAFHHNGHAFSGSKTFPDITEAEFVLEVEALDGSPVNGLEFTWEIDDWPEPDRKTMTAVKAVLVMYPKVGGRMPEERKNGDGRVIHKQNPAKERTRARIEIEMTPTEWDGIVELTTTKDTVELYTEANNDTSIDFPAEITVGSGKQKEFFLEGIAVSSGKCDTVLGIAIKNLSGEVDSGKVTVVETKLHIGEARIDSDTALVHMPDLTKFSVGRKLYKHRTKQTGLRTLIRVMKEPLDAPCELILRRKSGGDKVDLYRDKGMKNMPKNKNTPTDVEYSNESRSTPDVALANAPLRIAVDEVKSIPDGLAFWLDALAVTSEREVELHLDADEVDDSCDAVSCTVSLIPLEIKIKLQDSPHLPLAGDVTVKLTAPGSDVAIRTGVIDKGTGRLVWEVEASNYELELTPSNPAEKEMRLLRTGPKYSDRALKVFDPTLVEFELAPPYEKVQCVGYYIRAGAYIGKDAAVVRASTDTDETFLEKKMAQAMIDIDGRCAIMLDAIKTAYIATGVKSTDSKILKIFMAPEFYFRGTQGAYPLEAISKILTPPARDRAVDISKPDTEAEKPRANIQALKDEVDKGIYKDWLFVLGSAIGAIELEDDIQRTSAVGKITHIEGEEVILLWCEDGTGAEPVAPPWAVCVGDAGSFHEITNVVVDGVDGSWKRNAVTVLGDPTFPTNGNLAVSQYDPAVLTFVSKSAEFEVSSTVEIPTVGWFLDQGGARGRITKVKMKSIDLYHVSVTLDCDVTLTAGAAELDDGTNKHPLNLNTLRSSELVADYGLGSTGAAAAPGWRLWINNTGTLGLAPDESYIIRGVTAGGGPTRIALKLDQLPVFALTDTLTTGDVFYVQAGGQEKLITLEVQFTAPYVVAKGHFLEFGGDAWGLVNDAWDLTGNLYRIELWVPTKWNHGLAVTNDVTLSTPGEAEIINIALVRKGGAATPVRTDGGAQKELLVYKESISSVDFLGMDYGPGLFARADRRVVKLYGDPARRVRATVGTPGDMRRKDAYGAGTNRKEETNLSGWGGGSIFTMDGITFGLEVCLDHLEEKLVNYFATTAKPGDPQIQVQLIPSCGMSIKPPSRKCVPDGIIFNVDAYEYGCEIGMTGTSATFLAETDITTADVDKYFNVVDGTAGNGKIVVYEEIKKPDPLPV